VTGPIGPSTATFVFPRFRVSATFVTGLNRERGFIPPAARGRVAQDQRSSANSLAQGERPQPWAAARGGRGLPRHEAVGAARVAKDNWPTNQAFRGDPAARFWAGTHLPALGKIVPPRARSNKTEVLIIYGCAVLVGLSFLIWRDERRNSVRRPPAPIAADS
jgi:hypothetical protein